ncbi:unnamed protein product, partial [Rotaria sp. Silwood2]
VRRIRESNNYIDQPFYPHDPEIVNFLTNPLPIVQLPDNETAESTGDVVDSNTGRQGEEIVFRFLQWKHPDEYVERMNAKQESCLPYDIEIRTINHIELIEVKTTRIHDQHTFQISIGEIECLLANPINYHIY